MVKDLSNSGFVTSFRRNQEWAPQRRRSRRPDVRAERIRNSAVSAARDAAAAHDAMEPAATHPWIAATWPGGGAHGIWPAVLCLNLLVSAAAAGVLAGRPRGPGRARALLREHSPAPTVGRVPPRAPSRLPPEPPAASPEDRAAAATATRGLRAATPVPGPDASRNSTAPPDLSPLAETPDPVASQQYSSADPLSECRNHIARNDRSADSLRELRRACQDLRLDVVTYWRRGTEKLAANQTYTIEGYVAELSPTTLGVHLPPDAPDTVRKLLGGEINELDAVDDWPTLVAYTITHPDLQDAVAFTLTNLGANPSLYREAVDRAARASDRNIASLALLIAKDLTARAAVSLLSAPDLSKAFLEGALAYSDWADAVRAFPGFMQMGSEGPLVGAFSGRKGLPGCPEWRDAALSAVTQFKVPGADPASVALRSFPPILAIAGNGSGDWVDNLVTVAQKTAETPNLKPQTFRVHGGPLAAAQPVAGGPGGAPGQAAPGRHCNWWIPTSCSEAKYDPDWSTAGAASLLVELRSRFEQTPAVYRALRPLSLVKFIPTRFRKVSLEALVQSIWDEVKNVPPAERTGWIRGVLVDLQAGNRQA